MTASAPVTDIGINADLSVRELCRLHRAVKLNGTFFTATALFLIGSKDALTDNSDIVKVGLYAVIRTAADCDLELVRKHNITVTDIKPFVDFKAERICVDKTENAGRTLTGNNGTNLCARAARFKSSVLQEKDQFGDFIIGNALNFNCQTACHGNLG